MITIAEYFGKWEIQKTPQFITSAEGLLFRVNRLLLAAVNDGVMLKKNPRTGSYVSGEQYGGFRPAECTIGAARSAHKQALAVDVYDPKNALDEWLTDARLEEHELYREHPDDTFGWCHLSTKAPGSGRRTFKP